MLEPRDNFGTGAVALPGRNIFAPPAATNSDERARKRKVFDAAAACQPTAVSESIHDGQPVASEPAVRGLRLLVVLAFLLLAGAGAAPLVINLMGASSGRGISTPTPAPPPRLSAPPHHSPVARPRHPSTRNANSRARHRERRPDRARTRPNATASPPVGGAGTGGTAPVRACSVANSAPGSAGAESGARAGADRAAAGSAAAPGVAQFPARVHVTPGGC